MAGDWIKMRTCLASERAVMAICDLTDLDEFAVVGRLHAIWAWAGEHTTNGVVSNVTLKTIDRVTKQNDFGKSLVSVGWLQELPEGGVKFPRWSRHNSKAAKERALAAARQAKKRERDKRDEKRDGTVTSHATREEKKRGEKRRTKGDKSPLETPAFPPELSKNGFSELWNQWVKHRDEIKEPLTPTMVEKQLKMLAGLGYERAFAMIENTITMGWTGLREPEASRQKTTKNDEPILLKGLE